MQPHNKRPRQKKIVRNEVAVRIFKQPEKGNKYVGKILLTPEII